MAEAFIGTSGWVYKGWMGCFYPPGLPAARCFDYYARQFSSVEINNTFYRLPTDRMVQGWRDKAPRGFIFALKGSRFITQMKKLNVPRQSVTAFCRLVAGLGEHLGPILWQLPPNFHRNTERLERFLKQLPPGFRHAFEFRHPSWLAPEVFDLLRQFTAAQVSVSSLRMPMDLTVTADFIYLRFHGLEGGAAHDYTREELKPWADHCRGALRQGRTVYAYFNNDWNARAPANARELIRMVKA